MCIFAADDYLVLRIVRGYTLLVYFYFKFWRICFGICFAFDALTLAIND